MMPGMADTPIPTVLPLPAVARRLGVPATWLRAEAEAGRLPHLRAGARILMDLELIREIVAERARQSGKAVADAR
jgi:hypothetical protein